VPSRANLHGGLPAGGGLRQHPHPPLQALSSTREHGKAFRGYVASKRRYFYGLRVHLVTTAAGEPVE